jgi:hypothetical protein
MTSLGLEEKETEATTAECDCCSSSAVREEGREVGNGEVGPDVGAEELGKGDGWEVGGAEVGK